MMASEIVELGGGTSVERDFAGGFQRRGAIEAGRSRLFRPALSLNTPAVPEPAAWRADFNGVGGVMLRDLLEYLGQWLAGR